MISSIYLQSVIASLHRPCKEHAVAVGIRDSNFKDLRGLSMQQGDELDKLRNSVSSFRKFFDSVSSISRFMVGFQLLSFAIERLSVSLRARAQP